MQDTDTARRKLDGMLDAAGIPKKPSYNRAEVCSILGISHRTFWRQVTVHEVDEANEPAGGGRDPWTIDSYMTRGHYRVRYDELASYLKRNRTYDRIHAKDVHTLDLPGFV